MDQVAQNQFVKFDKDRLKCIFLDHRWGANLTKHRKDFSEADIDEYDDKVS